MSLSTSRLKFFDNVLEKRPNINIFGHEVQMTGFDLGHNEHVIQHLYKFTFLCKPLDHKQRGEPASHAVETLEIGWFAENACHPRHG
jgi:hypothetical protein